MKLIEGWYAILDSAEVGRSKPFGFMRFGIDLVAWRKQNGQLVVMRDLCPHRGAKLSIGRIIDQCKIECPFHGFEFQDSGACTLVPETGKSAENLKVQTFNVVEAHGFVWMWVGSTPAPTSEVHWFSDITEYAQSQMTAVWPAHISRCIENQLDYAHLPFVHKSTIGAHFDPSVEVDFQLDDNRIKFSPTGRAFIEFIFPNIWRNYISKDFQITLAFAPVSDEETKFYLRTHFNFMKVPILKEFLGFLFNLSNSYILNQDRRVVLSQRPKSSRHEDTENEKLYPSDKAIAHFRRLLKERETQIE